MANLNAYETYRQNAILTATPEELILLLYNGLVRFIMAAQKSIDDKNIQKANENIIKAENIISELRLALDMKYEVSHGLAKLYDYLYDRLVDANIKKDKEILEEVLRFVKDLRDTWAQAMKIAKQGGGTAAGQEGTNIVRQGNEAAIK